MRFNGKPAVQFPSVLILRRPSPVLGVGMFDQWR